MSDALAKKASNQTRPASPSFRRGKNIIAVASGKGGVGKTWFSITLCQTLARMGKRTLLFDGDLGLANVDVQLALMPKNDLGAVISGDCFGWNFGLGAGGFGGLLIATVVITVMYVGT